MRRIVFTVGLVLLLATAYIPVVVRGNDPTINAAVAVTLDGVAYQANGGFFKNLRTQTVFEYGTNANGQAVVNIGQGFQVGDIFEHRPPGALIIVYSCRLISRIDWLVSQGFSMTIKLKSPSVATDDDQKKLGTINTLNFEPTSWSDKDTATITFDNERVAGKAADMSVQMGIESQCDEYPGTVTKDDKALTEDRDYMGYDYIVIIVTQVKLASNNGDLEIDDAKAQSDPHYFKGPEPPNQGNGGSKDPPCSVAFDTNDLETVNTDYADAHWEQGLGWHTHMRLKIEIHYGYNIDELIGGIYQYWDDNEYDYDTDYVPIIWDWVL
jgi:hypothetical protein